MRLLSPEWLLLLPILAVISWATWHKAKARFQFPSVLPLKAIASQLMNPKNILNFFRLIVLSLLIMAMARPQSGRKYSESTSDGVDIILALDTSGSMQALDLKLEGKNVPRIDVVKSVGKQFMGKRVNDRLGIVVFGETAFLQCPLTLDHDMAIQLLDEVKLGVAGDSTSLGDAMAVGINHMKNLKAKSKILILLTDGSSNSGVIQPLKAAELAKIFQIKVYTIGVGIEGEAPFVVDTPIGKRVVYQRADLDEDTLKQIASVTGAKFFRAQDTEALKAIYNEIDTLEKTEAKVKQYAQYNELFQWLLIPALILLLCEIALGQTLLRKIP